MDELLLGMHTATNIVHMQNAFGRAIPKKMRERNIGETKVK